MKWIPASEITIEAGKTYHAKLPDAKTIGGTTVIDGTGSFQMSDGTFFWHEQGYVPIAKKEHHLLLILDEQADDCKDFFPVLEENYQAQIAGFYNDDKTDTEKKARQAVINEYKDLIAIYKSKYRPSTPQGGDKTIK